MNIHIRSRAMMNQILEDKLYKAYREGERSLDFLILFPVPESEKETILDIVKSYPVVLDARWIIGTLIFTAYIRH